MDTIHIPAPIMERFKRSVGRLANRETMGDSRERVRHAARNAIRESRRLRAIERRRARTEME